MQQNRRGDRSKAEQIMCLPTLIQPNITRKLNTHMKKNSWTNACCGLWSELPRIWNKQKSGSGSLRAQMLIQVFFSVKLHSKNTSYTKALIIRKIKHESLVRRAALVHTWQRPLWISVNLVKLIYHFLALPELAFININDMIVCVNCFSQLVCNILVLAVTESKSWQPFSDRRHCGYDVQ